MAFTIASFCCGLRAARELVALRAALTVRQMLPEAFVVNFIFFGMQTKPAPTKASMALFATRFGCVEASLRSEVRVMPVIGPAVDLMLLWTPAFFCALSRMLGHEAYVFGRPSDFSSWLGRRAKSSVVALPPSARVGLDS